MFVDVDADTATLDVAAARAARDRPHPRGDPGAPLRSSGGAARPRRPGASRTPPRRTARSTRGAVGRGRVQLLPDEEPRRHRRRRRGRHRRRRPRRDRSGCCAPHGLTGDYVHTRGRHQRAPVRGRGRGAACRSAARSTPTTPAAGRSRRATATPRPRCAGRRRTRATCTTSASPGSPTATPSGPALPFDTGVHYPRALTQQPAYAAFARAPCPEAEALGRRVRIVPVLPRDDRRRDRGGVSSDPVNPAVEAVSVVLPLLQRRGHDRLGWSTSRSRRSTRRCRRRRGHRRQRRLVRRLRRGPRGAHRRREPRLRVVTHEHNRGYGGALLSGFAASTKQWVFYTDGDGQFDPAELELLVAAGVRRRRRRAGLQAPPRRRHRCARVDRPRVPPVREAHVRAADPRHRLRLPPHPQRRARSRARSCTRPA